MTKSTVLLILFLLFLAGAFGYNYYFQPFNYLNADIQIVSSPSPVVEAEITNPAQNFVKGLSVEQKVGQMLAIGVDLDKFDQSKIDQYQSWIADHDPGFVTIFGTQVSLDRVNQLRSIYPTNQNVPLWTAVDHEGGTVQRLAGDGFTSLPSWQDLCSTQASVSAQLINQSIQQLATAKIDVVFAPVVDLSKNNPVLKSRICSDQPSVVVENADSMIAQLQKYRILPVLKHFPGIGSTTKDLHQSFDRVDVTATQASVYRSLLALYPKIGVMVTHVGVNNQFADIPCSLSTDCVGELSSNFPNLLIFSDALDMKSASFSSDQKSLPLLDVVMEAVEAGNQVLVFSQSVTPEQLSQIKIGLINRYQEDQYFQQKVDLSVENIIRHKMFDE